MSDKIAAVILATIAVLSVFVISSELATPCKFEDSRNCTWIAEDRGNGEGRSFTDFGGVTFFHP